MPTVKVQSNSGVGWIFRGACVRFPLLDQKAGHMRDLFIFIMISVCGSSKVANKELNTYVLRILIFLFSLSWIVSI